jgi:hypothetical protein
MRAPAQQWHAKIRLQGLLDSYTLRLRLPDLDDLPEPDSGAGQGGTGAAGLTGEHLVTSTRRRPPLNDCDRLILAARFEDYLNWRHAGPAAPRSAKQTADRIGWQAHTVAKRCENIRDRYARLGVPGLRGPRALEELAMLLISTCGGFPARPTRDSPQPDRPARQWEGSKSGLADSVRPAKCGFPREAPLCTSGLIDHAEPRH